MTAGVPQPSADQPPVGGAWAAEQLTSFVTAMTRAESGDIVMEAIVRAAEAVDAEVAAAVVGGVPVASVGFPRDRVPTEALRALVTGRPPRADLPGVGLCRVMVVPFEVGEDTAYLVIARTTEDTWTLDERNLLRGMARVLTLKCRANFSLSALQERQALLERLTRIQRSITSRAPLPEILQAIVSGAHELFGDTIVAVRRVCADDPSYAEFICSSGVESGAGLDGRILVGEGAGGRAIAEDRLVVMNAYAGEPKALQQFVRAGLCAAMAAPVREDGVTIGSIVVASDSPTRLYSEAEQEMLQSFADHVSIALTDARTVDSLRQALTDARHDAMHDVLTSLPNRALLRDRLSRAFLRSERHGTAVALVFLDLDGFKHVNDSLGHDAGDQLLVEVGMRFLSVVRETDTVARLGGDEFAVLVEDVANLSDVTDVADRLLEALTEPVSLAQRDVSVNASIGIAISSAKAKDSRTLLRNADVAMYEAKRSGGGRYVYFAEDMHQQTVRRLTIEQELRDAIARDELELHYQPIVEIETGRVVSLEALVRWRHPQKGLIAPIEFIPVAESSRLIKTLGAWVLRTACREAAGWSGDVGVAVNVSPRQVDARLLPLVQEVLTESGLPAERLKLEVTEGVAMAESAETAAVMKELHAAGVRLAIDDFGTGYSSLSRLRALPVDVLKIDRSFVADLPNGLALLSAIVGLCRGSGLTAVAEGVETAEQLDVLRRLGCARGQGYLFGRPAPAKEVPQMLAQSAKAALSPLPRQRGDVVPATT
jgi:diguanylate cyclase (GGDEF)-like protein